MPSSQHHRAARISLAAAAPLLLLLLLGLPSAAKAMVNQPYNCNLQVSFVTSVYDRKSTAVSGSIAISNPTKQPVTIADAGVVLAVTSTVPAGAPEPAPPAGGDGRGKLRPFRPYAGPYYPQAILEYEVPSCLQSAVGKDGKPSSAAVIPAGKTVTCAFKTPAAAVAGTDPKTVMVSVSMALSSGNGAALTGMCAVDANKLVVV